MATFAVSRIARRLLVVAATASSLVVAVVAPQGAAADFNPTVRVAVSVCADPAPGAASCNAMRMETVRANSPLARAAARTSVRGARPEGATSHFATGLAGGLTPALLAKVYGVDVNAAAGARTVAIVDAYHGPNVRADLNTFNAHYGIPAETTSSFRVVGQDGTSTVPVSTDPGWAVEEALDVQSVRALCRKCKILLVEGNSASFDDLATATNSAVALGAKIVSHSYGGIETSPLISAADAAAYNHPGVAMVASTGDDGWFNWDGFNKSTRQSSFNAPTVPASYGSVVAVGGTSLYLNADGTRASEQVWNQNGPSDSAGNGRRISAGASGGGCSTLHAAQLWQSKVAGYSGLGCTGGKRSTGDVAALADPWTGFDIYESATLGGWGTLGGTSLAAPLISAMFALAGGPGPVKYPALTLYGHFTGDRTHPLYDVKVGGNGLCGTSTPLSCSSYWSGSAPTPNSFGFGQLDCSWTSAGLPVANNGQCNAKVGYDGPTGVGVPTSVNAFKPMKPTGLIAYPGKVTHGVKKQFDGSRSSDPFPGGRLTKYAWRFGDGGTATGAKPSHKYVKKNRTYTITLTVTDSYGFVGTTSRRITTK